MALSILHRSSLSSIIAVTCLACAGSDPANTENTGGNRPTSVGGASTAGGSSAKTGSSTSGGSSTGGGSGAGGGGTRPASCDVMPILQTSCSGIICHGSPGKPAMYNTDLLNPPSGQSLDEGLIGKAANYDLVADPSACPKDDPELLIDPTSPSESLILKKIKGTQACGVSMPSTKTPLTQEQIDCFVDWVNAATGNSGTGGAGSGGATSGTGGKASTGGAGSGIPPTFQTVKTVFTDNITPCVSSDCHGGHQGVIDLRVDSGLLNRLTSSSSDICGMPIVDPGQPSNSALIKLLREGCGEDAANCTTVGGSCIPRMPWNCTEGVDCIPENYMKAIEQWITDGAKP